LKEDSILPLLSLEEEEEVKVKKLRRR